MIINILTILFMLILSIVAMIYIIQKIIYEWLDNKPILAFVLSFLFGGITGSIFVRTLVFIIPILKYYQY